MKTIILALIASVACASSSVPVEKITPAQAKTYIGKRTTVCGVVASANFAARSRRQPIILRERNQLTEE